MHELVITQSIFDIVMAQAEKAGAGKELFIESIEVK